jgi:hypothetical protein
MKSISVLQIEDRKSELLNIFINENREICKKHNMEYIILEKSSYHIPPYWAKIFEMKKIMRNNLHTDYFVWLDSDAFFVNFDNHRFQEFLKKYENYSIITTRNMPPWNIPPKKKFFNAGSFIMKNDIHTHHIMTEWISKYNSKKWQYIDSKWQTESEWSGIDYEQGSFVKYILNSSRYNNKIANIDYYYLNNNNCENNTNDTLVVHLAGFHKTINNTLLPCLEILQYNNKNNNKNIMIDIFHEKNDQILFFSFLGFLYFFILYVFVITRKTK